MKGLEELELGLEPGLPPAPQPATARAWQAHADPPPDAPAGGTLRDGPPLEKWFDELPCMGLLERDGMIVARNALAARMTGQQRGAGGWERTPVSDVFPDDREGGSPLVAGAGRTRVDCLLRRRHGAPLGVSAVAQEAVMGGERCRLLLLIEHEPCAPGEDETSLMEDVLDATQEASAIIVASRVLHVNCEFTRLFGYTLAECVGMELTELVVPDGRLHETEMMQHSLRTNGRSAMETVRKARSGELIDVGVLSAKVRLGREAVGTLITYRDIRAQKQEEARLRHSARHDALTGLPNRAMFLERVQLTLGRLKRRPDRGFAVVFLDLDGFKQVNDRMGHAAGDALLLTIAERLRACLRPQDAVARFGGDEFAMLLDECGDEAEVDRVSARIQREVQQVVELAGAGFETAATAQVSASMGVALARTGYRAAEEVMLHADSAMYSAKAAGGARHVIYQWAAAAKPGAVLGFLHEPEAKGRNEEGWNEGGRDEA